MNSVSRIAKWRWRQYREMARIARQRAYFHYPETYKFWCAMEAFFASQCE